jgi:hypothetical protein
MNNQLIKNKNLPQKRKYQLLNNSMILIYRRFNQKKVEFEAIICNRDKIIRNKSNFQ